MNLFGTTHFLCAILIASAAREEGCTWGKMGLGIERNAFLDECCLEDSVP